MVGEARRKRREHLPKKKKKTKKSQTLSLFSPTLGLFDAAEEEGNDTNVFFTNTIENPESGVTCEVVVDAKSGMAKAGIERDEDGDFLYQDVRRKRVEKWREVRNGWNRGFGGVRDV